MTLFTKILKGEIPGQIVYQDEHCFAIRDINPQAPVHLLIIPKTEIPTMNDATPEQKSLIGHMMLVAPELARKEGIAERGYRLVINTNAHAGQTVPHIHIHLLGGRAMSWPPG